MDQNLYDCLDEWIDDVWAACAQNKHRKSFLGFVTCQKGTDKRVASEAYAMVEATLATGVTVLTFREVATLTSVFRDKHHALPVERVAYLARVCEAILRQWEVKPMHGRWESGNPAHMPVL